MADDILLKLSVDDRDLIRTRREQQKFQYQIALIEKEFRRGNITSARYNAELAKQAKELSKLGGGYSRANSDVRKYAYSLRQASDAQVDLAMAMTASGKGMRRMEVLAQQAGYQIGDLAVQIQGGTNAAVALGQQGSQLLGFFGPTGALLGAGLAISTAFIAPLLKAQEEVAELEKKTKEALDAVRAKARATGLGVSEEELSFIDRAASAQVDYEKALKALQDRKEHLTRTGEYSERATKREVAAVNEARAAVQLATSDYIAFQEARALSLAGPDLSAFGPHDREIMSDERRAELAQIAADAAEKGRKMSEAELIVARQLTAEEQTIIEARKISNDELLVGQGIVEAIAGHQKDLVAQATAYGEQLGVGLGRAIQLIQQAKAEATIGLDAFGDFGNWKQGQPSSSKPPKRSKSEVQKYEEQLQLQRDLIGMTEDEAAVRQALGSTYNSTSKRIIDGLVAQTEQVRKLKEQQEQSQFIADTIGDSFEKSFMSVVDGTMSVKDAFKSMAADIIKDLYRVLVVQKMVAAVKSYLGFADGGVFQGGSQVKAFADGGVVGSPTYFPMSGGKTGLMGEAGPEAIMPLKRGKGGKLGVSVEGGTPGDTITVNQTINVSTGVQQTVRAEIKSLMPQIADSAKSAVVSSKRRGGSYGRSF